MRIWILFLVWLVGCAVPLPVVTKQVATELPLKSDWVAEEKMDLPESYQLDVPFVPQAPFANWEVHNDSCEEAGLLLAHYYYTGEYLSKDQANVELLDMIAYQNSNFGGHFDIYTDLIARLAKEYYGYEPRIIEVDIEQIKAEIYAGNPVILLTTAAYLKPEKSDYPEMGYHIIDAVGYNQYGIITHDVGTITGENTVYSNHVIMNAIADYDNLAVVLK